MLFSSYERSHEKKVFSGEVLNILISFECCESEFRYQFIIIQKAHRLSSQSTIIVSCVSRWSQRQKYQKCIGQSERAVVCGTITAIAATTYSDYETSAGEDYPAKLAS